MSVLFPGSVLNSDSLEGVVTSTNPGHEAKCLKMVPLSYLLEGVQPNKQEKIIIRAVHVF